MITLRPYQSDGIAKIRQAYADGRKAPLYVLPTGGGKTRVMAYMAESAQRRARRVLIVAHRTELIDQIIAALEDCDVHPDVIAAGYGRRSAHKGAQNTAVTVASAQTLINRLNTYPAPTMLLVDESHHVSNGSGWSKIIRAYPEAKLLGVTATPIRLDGRGLASHFDHLIVGPSVAELMDQGYLARARVFQPPTVDTSGLHTRGGEYITSESESLMDTPAITGNALTHYRKHGNDRPALVFCTSVKHSHSVAAQFRDAGISAVALDGGTDRDVRRMTVQDYRDGEIRVLASCDLFAEGFDVPGVHVGIMLRPTQSEGLWRQQVGRILRPAPNKPSAIILDHVGGTIKFGLPDEPREWSLAEDTERKKRPVENNRVCPSCFATMRPRASKCDECGASLVDRSGGREIEEREGDLVELTAEEIHRRRERQRQGQAKDLAALIAHGRAQGMRDPAGWAAHVLAGRQAKAARKSAALKASDFRSARDLL